MGPLGFGLVSLEWERDAKLIEVVSEIAVIISLYAAGVKMREPWTSKAWVPPLILATITMTAISLSSAAIGWSFLGLSFPAAILLGAVLAPTDPVLADEVQVEDAGDNDPLRQTLTGEAGFNDGSAFPLVLLAVGLANSAAHELGEGYWKWLTIDLIWKITGGLALGWLAGVVLGKLTLWLSEKNEEEKHGVDELRSLGFIALVYGLALIINTYAFLAVFAAAVGLRQVEMKASRVDGNQADKLLDEQSSVATALEHLIQVILVVVVGILFSTHANLGWKPWVFALILIGAVRPVAVLVTLHTSQISFREKLLAGWFGIKGVGTVFYLAHAIVLGIAGSLGADLQLVANCCVASISLSIFIHGVSMRLLCR